MLRAAVSEIGEEGVILIAEWVAKAPGRPEKLREGGYDSPDTYLRPSHRGEYLDLARAWKPDGKATPNSRCNGVTPGSAWSIVLSGLKSNRWQVPPEWHPNPNVQKAINESLRYVGGVRSIGQANDFTLKDIQSRFQARFMEVYHA